MTFVAGKIQPEEVEWVVNSNADLGVKLGDQFFWLYKGKSLVYEDPADAEGGPMQWRPVNKREFGESAHPVNDATVSLADSDAWQPLPAPPAQAGGDASAGEAR